MLHSKAAAACCTMVTSAVPVELLDCSDLLHFGSESAVTGSVMQEKVARVWNSQDCAKTRVQLCCNRMGLEPEFFQWFKGCNFFRQ